MKQLLLVKLWQIAYPYWVVSKVVALVLGSLAVLLLSEWARSLSKTAKLTAQELDYVNRTN
jgi:hypothetical protein